MATINGFQSSNMYDVNLYYMNTTTWNDEFYNNINLSYKGTVYQDEYDVYYGYGNYVLAWVGSNFTCDYYGNVTGGTVQALQWFAWNGSSYSVVYEVLGASVSAVSLYNASLTPSTSDDFAIISKAFSGADTFNMSNYNDTINGYSGNDVMNANGGNDSIEGGVGNDTISAGSGGDRIVGNDGKDILTGGSGNDRFIFVKASESSSISSSSDVITDFVQGQDKIDLSAIDAFASTGSNEAFTWRGTSAFNSSTQGEVRYQKYDNSGTSNDYTMV